MERINGRGRRPAAPSRATRAPEGVTRSALRESEQRFRSLFANAPLGVFITSREGMLLDANPTGLEMLGVTAENLAAGVDINHFYAHPHDRARYVAALEAAEDGVVRAVELRIRTADAKQRVWRVTSNIRKDANGDVLGYQAFARDVTKERSLEAQLRQAQKLEAIGTLAGGIAHDFNNILAPIVGYTDMTLEELDPESDLYRYQTRVARAAKRATELVQQILTFSRRTEQERRPVDLREIVEELQTLLRASIPATVDICTEVGDAPLVALADPTQVHQVLLNLCTNAAQAMNGTGGSLALTVEAVDLTDTDVQARPPLTAGPHVRVRVRDDGPGKDEATLARIFEPFFTTKVQDEGTGLGLSVAHGIVTSHGGWIHAESTPGEGTLFEVLLPRHFEEALEAPVGDTPIRGGTERILFVDDEDDIAQLGGRVLDRLGYEVRSLTGAREALELFRMQPDYFDLVMTDLTMPDMTGLQLAAEIQRIRPDMPVVLFTGSHDHDIESARLNGAFRMLLMKPLGLRDLAHAIRSCLDRS